MVQLATKLSENQQRILILVFLIFIILFVLVGAISLGVKKIMQVQGSKADQMLKEVVDANYFQTEGKLIRYGIKKNARVFFKEAKVPFLILFIAWIGFLLYCLFSGNWSYNPLNNDNGFATLLYKFGEWPKSEFFGLNLPSGWPPVLETPRFVWAAWFSYLFVPANVVGIIWFLLSTQAYISRSFRIYKIARKLFRKKLVPEQAPTSETNN